MEQTPKKPSRRLFIALAFCLILCAFAVLGLGGYVPGSQRFFDFASLWNMSVVSLPADPPVEKPVVRYTDEQGRVFYVDDIKKVPERLRAKVDVSHRLPKINRIEFTQLLADSKSGAAFAKGSNKVEIFVTSWCGYCKQLEGFLRQKHIAYKRYDIEKDANGRKIHAELGGGGVPVTRIGTKVIRGFAPDEISASLKTPA